MNIKIFHGIFKEIDILNTIKITSLVYGSGKNKELANAPVTDTNYIRNKHLNNPLGSSTRIFIQENSSRTGHIFIIPRAYFLTGKLHEFFVASDLVSKSKTPGGGIFLFKEAQRLTKSQKKPLLNFSNIKSERIYSSILRIQPILELDFSILSFNFRNTVVPKKISLLKNRNTSQTKNINIIYKNRRIEFEKIETFDARTEKFLREKIPIEENIGYRSSDILNWRFTDSNKQKYTRLLIQMSGEIIGFTVLSEKIYMKRKFAVIVDSIVVNSNQKQMKLIKNKLLDIFPYVSAIIEIRNRNSESSVISQFRGLNVPRKLLPERIRFYLSNIDPNLISYFNRAHLTLFDTDIL